MRNSKWLVQIGVTCLCLGFIVSPGGWFRGSPTLYAGHSLLRHLIHGELNGRHEDPDVHVDFLEAQPGDILVCHNAHGGYGYWTHAGLYVGHGRVVDANSFSHGTLLQDASQYQVYDVVILLRPNVSAKVREEAARVALSKIGTPYDPLGALTDTHSTYCSKLIWEAYNRAGMQLYTAKNWILPDQIVANPRMIQIAHWGSCGGATSHCGN